MGQTSAATSEQYYIHKGLKTKKSAQREDTEAGRIAAYIIDQIPQNFDVYEDYDLSEEHLAEAIIDSCGRYIRYCPQIGWMTYSAEDGCWKERYAESAVQRVVIHFGQLLFEGTVEINQGELRFARHILSSAGINAVKSILRHHPLITIEQDQFDLNPDLLNCKGDLYNLRTGEVRPVEPEDYVSRSVYCKAAPAAGKEMPALPKLFKEFLMQVTSKDGVDRPDLALFIMYWFGYCLTGDTGAAFLVNFHGGGKNGKSVLLKLMMRLFGDYAAPIPTDVVIENRFASQFNLEGLPGVRLGILADAPEGRLNMEMLKPIITGDTLSAQRKFMKNFAYKSVCKISVGSNPRLTLKNTGMAISRRIRMIPFDYQITDEEEIINFEQQLLEDAPGILALLIYLAKDYYRQGGGPRAFPSCRVVDETSREYLESEDLVGRWKQERTEAAPGNAVSATELYKDFIKWAEDEGVRKRIGKNKFGEHLSVHLPAKKKLESGWVYQDVMLKGGTAPLPGDGGG
jgi:putative DNA primase/helicase